ncbi:MAG TPA: hypothetical protein VER58_11125 [Thermoanaerobaculia bacterium]|nr:hypothetical protein [Thermoanaerobaculia bacterium]
MLKVVSALLMSAGVAYASDPGTASGTMTVAGKKTQLRYAVAKTTENAFDKKKTDMVVLLSNIPVTVEEFSSIGKMMDLSDSGKLTGVEVEITPEKSIISGTLYSPDFHFQGNSFSAVGMHQFDSTKLTKNEAAGKLSTTHASSFRSVSYSYSATFDAVVKAPKAPTPPKLKGTPIPAGGDIGKSYLAFVQSVTKGDLAAVQNGVSADRAKEMKADPDFKKFFPLMQAMEPKNIKLTGGAVDGDNATLTATGTSDGDPATGTITMVREGGKWKVAKESWSSTHK